MTVPQTQKPLNRIFLRHLWRQLFVPLLVSSLLMNAIVTLIGLQSIEKQQNSVNKTVVYTVDTYLENATHILDVLALRKEITDLPQMELAMEVVQRGYPYFNAFFLLDNNGTVLIANPNKEEYLGLDMSRQEYFAKARGSAETVFSKPFISLMTGKPAVYLAKAIPGRGVIAGELNLDELEYSVPAGRDLAWQPEVFITDHAGNVLAHPDPQLVARQDNLSGLPVVEKARQGETPQVYWYNHHLYIGSAAIIQRAGWVVASQANLINVFGPQLGPSALYVIVSTIILILFLRLFGSQFQHTVSAPLSKLSQVTTEIAEGNYAVNRQAEEIPQTFLELASLVHNFTNMAQSVLTREKMLQHLASHDALTNLPSRAIFHKQLSDMIEQARDRRQTFAVLFIDLDDFKLVNDAFGHHIGDLALQLIASQIVASTRPTDIIGRLGGDEFAVIVDGVRTLKSTVAVAEQILRLLSQPMYIEGNEIYISSSIGISLYPDDGREPDALIQNADTAMYHAKREGKNGYQFYSLEMETQAQERHTLTSYLHHALEQNELELHYQPIFSTHTCQMTGNEALIRWINPKLGPVSPTRFIPLADESGLILPIGEWIVRTACLQNQNWNALGYSGLTVSVNISERQLKHPGLLGMVEKALEETGLPPYLLKLEMTENIFFQNFKSIAARLAELKRLGIMLSLDDFGTGYSTLSCLTQIPFDEIKIDRSLTRFITTNQRDAAIVKGIVTIAHDLDMQVVAEGIESEEQLEFTEQLGCDLLQGFYFYRPLAAGQLTRLLEEQALAGNQGPD